MVSRLVSLESTSQPISTRALQPPSPAPSDWLENWAQRSGKSHYLIRRMPSRRTTSSLPPKRRPIWRATMEYATGPYVLSAGYYDAYYRKAQRVRSLIAEDFRRTFAAGVNLLLTPTTPTPAFKAGEKTGDPVAMYLADIFVCPINLAGLPAVSIPAGRSEGLPIGAQLIAPAFDEERLLAAAAALERAIPAEAEVR